MNDRKSLDDVWRQAEAETAAWAQGARFRSVSLTVFRELNDEDQPVRYAAMAERFPHHVKFGPPVVRTEEEADGPTPVAALMSLIDRLRAVDRMRRFGRSELDSVK